MKFGARHIGLLSVTSRCHFTHLLLFSISFRNSWIEPSTPKTWHTLLWARLFSAPLCRTYSTAKCTSLLIRLPFPEGSSMSSLGSKQQTKPLRVGAMPYVTSACRCWTIWCVKKTVLEIETGPPDLKASRLTTTTPQRPQTTVLDIVYKVNT